MDIKWFYIILVVLAFSVVEAKPQSIIVYKNPSIFLKSSSIKSSESVKILKQKVISHATSWGSILRKRQSQERSIVLITVESDKSPEAICEILKTYTDISDAEPNYELQLFESTVQDPMAIRQTYLEYQDMYQLWSFPVNAQVVVALIDTGVDLDHEDLAHAIYNNPNELENREDDDYNGYIDDVHGYSWIDIMSDDTGNNADDDHGHGTHLAGIIAAAHNDRGISGIHPEAHILPLKIFDSKGRATQLEAALAIRYAVDQGADIINCSWGYYRKTSILASAIEYAVSHGVMIIAASGNSGASIPMYPAAFDGVIGVGSVDADTDVLSSYSNTGKYVDFVLPGTNVFSTA